MIERIDDKYYVILKGIDEDQIIGELVLTLRKVIQEVAFFAGADTEKMTDDAVALLKDSLGCGYCRNRDSSIK